MPRVTDTEQPETNASLVFRLSRQDVELARLALPLRGPWPREFAVDLEHLDWMRDRKAGRSQRMTMLAELLEGARERKKVLAPQPVWDALIQTHPRLTGPNCELFCVKVDHESEPRAARLIGFDWRSGALRFKVGRPA